jgi:signal transduction histidine kinase
MKAAAQLVLRRAKEGKYPTQELTLIDTIVQQSERMARLIEELLDVSRLRTGNLEIQPEPFDLSALAREVVENSRLGNPGFTFELRADGQVWVNADRDRIAQVLGNLLDNSVKYGARGGDGKAEVLVETLPDEKKARIGVKDNGAGFEPSQSERIFERFSRLGSINHHSRGMGLGLFICRQIIVAHGGMIVADSPGPGRGATFTLTLPLGEF